MPVDILRRCLEGFIPMTHARTSWVGAGTDFCLRRVGESCLEDVDADVEGFFLEEDVVEDVDDFLDSFLWEEDLVDPRDAMDGGDVVVDGLSFFLDWDGFGIAFAFAFAWPWIITADDWEWE